MKVALIERKLFGGTCVNTGCIPTKTLVASAYAAHLARRAADFGVDRRRPGQRRHGGGEGAQGCRRRQIPRDSVEAWLRGMDGLHGLRGPCPLRDPPTRVRGRRRALTAERIFINVGGRAIVPDMPGIDDVQCLTNTTHARARHRCPAISWSSAAAMSGWNSPRCSAASARSDGGREGRRG